MRLSAWYSPRPPKTNTRGPQLWIPNSHGFSSSCWKDAVVERSGLCYEMSGMGRCRWLQSLDAWLTLVIMWHQTFPFRQRVFSFCFGFGKGEDSFREVLFVFTVEWNCWLPPKSDLDAHILKWSATNNNSKNVLVMPICLDVHFLHWTDFHHIKSNTIIRVKLPWLSNPVSQKPDWNPFQFIKMKLILSFYKKMCWFQMNFNPLLKNN